MIQIDGPQCEEQTKQLLKAEPIAFKYPASNLKDPAETTTNAVHVW